MPDVELMTSKLKEMLSISAQPIPLFCFVLSRKSQMHFTFQNKAFPKLNTGSSFAGHTENLHGFFEGTTSNPGKISLAIYAGMWSFSGW
jgi:hypothetical protein